MSKRHAASRRRTYGRRQHELHERMDRRDRARRADRAWRAGQDVGLDPVSVHRRAADRAALRLRRLMAVYQGARRRAPLPLGLDALAGATAAAARAASASPRPTRATRHADAPAPAARAPRPRRAARRPSSIGLALAAIVIVFSAAFLSLSQSVRVAATGYDIVRLVSEHDRLEAIRQDLRVGRRAAPQRARDPQAGARRRPRPARRAAPHPRPLASDARCSVEPIRGAACSCS